ncbi:GTPase HflX [Iamia majanohamensis]|uniref:GTPase HflX n=1 Tax=Iamia majanohamensis TaxID=467976 RepID=A0AAE9YAD5_9ACTN|nr:GTPase HflX [Iamia majanohamensis]WCO65357.1 GTPase HflX [Iamia majanohamensis]
MTGPDDEGHRPDLDAEDRDGDDLDLGLGPGLDEATAGDDGDALTWRAPDDEDSHRGAFGDYGSTGAGFIERTFRERILLVGVTLPPAHDDDTEASLDELELLVDTAGADVVGRVLQRRSRIEPATYIGSGKVAELRQLADAVDCDTVVFDDELSPAQQNNLEKRLGRTAIDRTAVILDIFAQNASSQEGKAQVELAMHRYRLPRLRGRGTSLSQQAGGAGGGLGARRGPGETQLEVDRRRVLRRVHKLEAELRDIDQHRATQRKARHRSRTAHVALVGYTNAGKSTLLNRLTDAEVHVEDRLFATLDATTRRLALPGGETVFATDTVGFVRKLPHHLVQAFRSTLDVAAEADLLVHVVDASSPDPELQMAAVRDVLDQIGAGAVPELLCVNKADLTPEAKRLVDRHPGAVAVSAATGAGIEELLAALADRLRAVTTVVSLEVPFARGDVLAEIHREGEVLSEEPGSAAMEVVARLDDAGRARLSEFVVGP